MEHLIEFSALCKTVTISVVAWILILPLLPFFSFYRITIDIILRIKHGKIYGGLFDMPDCLFFMPNSSKCSVTGIFYIKSDREINLFGEMRKVFEEKVFSNPCTYPKMTSSKHDFGGYPYWLRNGITVDDTIKQLQIPQDKVLTEEYLKDLTGKLSMKEYPKNETILWEIYISEESINNKNTSACYRYPVVVRVHHSICDGTSLVELLLRLFGDESSQNYGDKLFKTLFKEESGKENRRSTREVIKMSLEHLIEVFALCKTVTISLVVWILMLPLLPFFSIYRITIDIILRIKHGKNYGGLFDMPDCLFFVPNASKCSMTGIFYVKSDREINVLGEVRKVFQEKIFSNPCTYPKMTSSKHSFGGYPYWLKNGVAIDDTIKSLQMPKDKVFTEEYFKEITGKISVRNYPKDETVLWEVYVSEKALDNKNTSACYRYPVVVRVHHGICDGTAMFAMLLRLFGDESSQNYGDELFKTLFKAESGKESKRSVREVIKMSLVKLIETIRLCLDFIFLAPGRHVEGNQLKHPDHNALYTHSCSGEKIVAWAVEDCNECIPLVKNIRHKTNSKFMSVVCTAISASMTNYFRRNFYPIPDYTSGLVLQLTKFPSGDRSKPVELENKSAIFIVKLPTDKKPNTLIQTLKHIDGIMKQETNYSDCLISRFAMVYLAGIIPVKILSILFGLHSHTFIISNIPGGSQINVLDGCVFERVIGFAPNFRGVGISLTLLSYDNRFHIGIMVDKALTKSQKEVQRIADDIIYYIKLMDTEVRKIYEE